MKAIITLCIAFAVTSIVLGVVFQDAAISVSGVLIAASVGAVTKLINE